MKTTKLHNRSSSKLDYSVEMLIKPDDPFKQLHACSFHEWYNNFEKITILSKFLQIPSAVVDFLHNEIIILPKECYSSSGDTVLSAYDGEDTEITETPEFPEFSAAIAEAIESLSGAVFLKTNWHSPRDAMWITMGQTLKVQDITDVYQLLKASSIVKEDLGNLSGGGHSLDPVLVMRKWEEIHPGTEFRCFVKNRKLIAISPRDWPHFHKHILSHKKDIISDIVSIFKEKIKFQFPLDDFVFDVVRSCKDKVLLMDFSPFNEKFTDSLACEWSELNADSFGNSVENGEEGDCPELRYLIEDCGIQPNRRNNYGIPQDILDIFSNSSSQSASSNLNDMLASALQEVLRIENDEEP